nr:hypothetical protein [Tanacetum cinerariifolium]
MLDPDLTSQTPPVVVPPIKKSDKSLKAKKTTRTMNPDAKNIMKHGEMLGKSCNVSFKKIAARVRSKVVDACMVNESIESWEDASDVSNGMDVDVGKNGSNESVNGKVVSNSVFESNCASSKTVNECLDENSGDSPKGINVMPEIPIPVNENPILNLDFVSGGVDLVRGVKSMSNFEVGEGSNVNDVDMSENDNIKKPFSFMSVLTGDRVSGNNKLKIVPGSVNNEGIEVAEMDIVMENRSTKWNMTVIRNFVGYIMSYREIMGNLRVHVRRDGGGFFCAAYPKVSGSPLREAAIARMRPFSNVQNEDKCDEGESKCGRQCFDYCLVFPTFFGGFLYLVSSMLLVVVLHVVVLGLRFVLVFALLDLSLSYLVLVCAPLGIHLVYALVHLGSALVHLEYALVHIAIQTI